MMNLLTLTTYIYCSFEKYREKTGITRTREYTGKRQLTYIKLEHTTSFNTVTHHITLYHSALYHTTPHNTISCNTAHSPKVLPTTPIQTSLHLHLINIINVPHTREEITSSYDPSPPNRAVQHIVVQHNVEECTTNTTHKT